MSALPCPICGGSGAQYSGVVYMGSRETISCDSCTGTGTAPIDPWEIMEQIEELQDVIEESDSGSLSYTPEQVLELLQSFLWTRGEVSYDVEFQGEVQG